MIGMDISAARKTVRHIECEHQYDHNWYTEQKSKEEKITKIKKPKYKLYRIYTSMPQITYHNCYHRSYHRQILNILYCIKV